MAYKMKGHTLPGIKQKSPAKIAPLIAMAGKAILGKVAGKVASKVMGEESPAKHDKTPHVAHGHVGKLSSTTMKKSSTDKENKKNTVYFDGTTKSDSTSFYQKLQNLEIEGKKNKAKKKS